MAEAKNQDRYTFDHSIDAQRENYITDQLVAFNLTHSTTPVGEYEPLPLHIYVSDQAGSTLGGLVGRTHAIPSWLEVSIIWINERARHQGLGRQLMERAEREAYQRGCRYARVATSNYQAPAFYQKTGIHALRNPRKLSTRRNSVLPLEEFVRIFA